MPDMNALSRRLLVLLLCAPTLAHAWGSLGHRLVAELAEPRLVPAAREQVRRLLATSGDTHLADVANWADGLRDDPELRKRTARLHYVNFDSSACRYEASRICANGDCVVGAIERYAAILGDPRRGDAERAEALRFVVHFVADAHQPLHAGYRRDKGGNDYQVQLDGKGTNLHAVWDSRVLGSLRISEDAYARRLTPPRNAHGGGTPAQWAEESCRATRDDGIYPRGHRIDASYLTRLRPLAERRVRAAAVRLADLLNRELGRR